MVGGDRNLFVRKGGASQKQIGKRCSRVRKRKKLEKKRKKLDMMLVGPEEGFCPGQASVLTTICPGARRHPSQM